jgi:hypothetical protein
VARGFLKLARFSAEVAKGWPIRAKLLDIERIL